MIGAIIDLLALPFRWVFQESEEVHIDDISNAMKADYEKRFGEPWSALETRVLARHPEWKNF